MTALRPLRDPPHPANSPSNTGMTSMATPPSGDAIPDCLVHHAHRISMFLALQFNVTPR